jgi:hypothetical protein
MFGIASSAGNLRPCGPEMRLSRLSHLAWGCFHRSTLKESHLQRFPHGRHRHHNSRHISQWRANLQLSFAASQLICTREHLEDGVFLSSTACIGGNARCAIPHFAHASPFRTVPQIDRSVHTGWCQSHPAEAGHLQLRRAPSSVEGLAAKCQSSLAWPPGSGRFFTPNVTAAPAGMADNVNAATPRPNISHTRYYWPCSVPQMQSVCPSQVREGLLRSRTR